eukprot:649157-Amphidinium_carterae.1
MRVEGRVIVQHRSQVYMAAYEGATPCCCTPKQSYCITQQPSQTLGRRKGSPHSLHDAREVNWYQCVIETGIVLKMGKPRGSDRILGIMATLLGSCGRSCCRSCAGCITRCSSCLSKKEGLGKVVVSVEWRDIPEGEPHQFSAICATQRDIKSQTTGNIEKRAPDQARSSGCEC